LEKNQKILGYVLDKILRLWHPFMPFITEHIWKESGEKTLLMMESWPKSITTKESEQKVFELMQKIIIAIRNARLENNIDVNKKIEVIIDIKNEPLWESILNSNEELVRKLRTGVERIKITLNGEKIKSAIHRSVQGINIYIPTEGLIDKEKEKLKYEKELSSMKNYISNLSSKLESAEFLAKAPEKIVSQQKEAIAQAKIKLAEITKHLQDLL